MPTLMIRKLRILGPPLLIASISLAGCGSTASPSATTKPYKTSVKSKVAGCLERGGASFATSLRDLAFLKQAEDDESVSRVGLAFDKETKQIVRVWTAATFERHPPEWTIWFAQPLSTDMSPFEVLAAKPKNGFVMFVNRPSQRERAETSACLRIGSSGSQVQFSPDSSR
jgi:hypothetical protein